MIRVKKSLFLSLAFAAALTAPLAGAFAADQEPALTSDAVAAVAAVADPQLVAANQKMQRLSEEFNAVSGLMTKKANPDCRNCQGILKQFDGDYSRLTNGFDNTLARLTTVDVEGPEFVNLASSYNTAMEQLLAKYRGRAANAPSDSLCGKCGEAAKAAAKTPEKPEKKKK